jgi:hypothetical protein
MVAYINNDAATHAGSAVSFVNSNGLPRLKCQDNAKVLLKLTLDPLEAIEFRSEDVPSKRTLMARAMQNSTSQHINARTRFKTVSS